MTTDLMNRDFDDLVPNFFDSFGKNFFRSMTGSALMKTDITDDDDHYTVNAELPGFKKDGIQLDYHEDTLTITANHELTNEMKNDEGNVIQSERSFNNVNRQFYLPNVDFEKINAEYDGGLLKITLPKTESIEYSTHQIKIN